MRIKKTFYIKCPKNTFQIVSYLRLTVLFSLLFVYFHTSFHPTKSFMSGTVQREFIHSSIANTGRENLSRLITITLNMRVIWQNRWYWFGPRIFPYLFSFFWIAFQEPEGWKPNASSRSIPGPRPRLEWWEIQFKRRKKAPRTAPPLPHLTPKSPPSTSPGAILRSQTKTRCTYWT